MTSRAEQHYITNDDARLLLSAVFFVLGISFSVKPLKLAYVLLFCDTETL